MARIRDHVAKKLMDIVFVCKQRGTIHRNINVDSAFLKGRFQASMLGNSNSLGIWDDRFTGVRYVKLHQFRKHMKWDLPVLHLERRAQGPSLEEEKGSPSKT